MQSPDIEKLKYPIGRYTKPEPITSEYINNWIRDIEALPGQVKELVNNLDDKKLELRYRPGGWSIRQVINHLADSHMNSFIRFKLALTEDKPTIRPYLQEKWAEMPDACQGDINYSIQMLEGLHHRWVILLKNLTPEQYKIVYLHPERSGDQLLDATLGLYAWHGKHHLAHIKLALESGVEK